MKILALIFFLLVPFACGQGIGVSPSSIEWNSRDWKEIIVFNPTDEEITFAASGQNIEFSQNSSQIKPKSSIKISARPSNDKIGERIYIVLKDSRQQSAGVAIKASYSQNDIARITGAIVGIAKLYPAGVGLIIILAVALIYLAARKI